MVALAGAATDKEEWLTNPDQVFEMKPASPVMSSCFHNWHLWVGKVGKRVCPEEWRHLRRHRPRAVGARTLCEAARSGADKLQPCGSGCFLKARCAPKFVDAIRHVILFQGLRKRLQKVQRVSYRKYKDRKSALDVDVAEHGLQQELTLAPTG
eukprot:1612524-Amphidinium_carterae.1